MSMEGQMTEPAYLLRSGNEPGAPILFASPHSGRFYPDSFRAALRVPLIDLQRTEDAFVDELFQDVTQHGASLLTARYARSCIDLNRDPAEIDRSMIAGRMRRLVLSASARVEAGLGCLPKIGASGELIYARQLSLEEAEFRLNFIHDAYHKALYRHLTKLRERAGEAFLIDCHSMPSRQPGRRPLPDIVLGDRFGTSCTSLLTREAEQAFKRLGYRVARNAPYAGGYITLRYGRPVTRIHALQIEINRGLYLHETRVEKTADFDQIKADMLDVAARLTDFARISGRPALAAE